MAFIDKALGVVGLERKSVAAHRADADYHYGIAAYTPPKLPEPKLLHRIGRVSVWHDPVNGGGLLWAMPYISAYGVGSYGEYLAKLETANGEPRTWRGMTPRDAIRGLRRYMPRQGTRRGELTAYRCWKVNNGVLAPLTDCGRGRQFTGPILEAHELPTMENESGLYSVKEQDAAWVQDGYQHDAYGTVGLYGRVIEHESGYRSQYQVVRRIVLLGEYPDWFVKGMADAYQCDVTVGQRKPKKDENSPLAQMLQPNAFTNLHYQSPRYGLGAPGGNFGKLLP